MRKSLPFFLTILCFLLLLQSLAQASFYTRPLSLQTTRLKGSDVQAIQRYLLTLGYSELGEADGVFGPKTRQAVLRFQRVNGNLTADGEGVVGPNTWALMFYNGQVQIPLFVRPIQLQNPRISGFQVGLMQERLLELGYSELGIADSIYGPKTQAAVIAFQRRLRSAGGVKVRTDGVVDSITWANLFSDFAPEKR